MVNNIVDEVLMNGLLVFFLMEEMVRGFQHGDVLIKVDVLSSNRVEIGWLVGWLVAQNDWSCWMMAKNKDY